MATQNKKRLVVLLAALAVAFGFPTLLTPVFAASKVKVLHSFGKGKDGVDPGDLIFDATGNLYGTTRRGGAHDAGTVFQLTPDTNGRWTERVLHSFNDNFKDGAYPASGLVFDPSGNLYGTTKYGGNRPTSRAQLYTCRRRHWVV